MTLSDKPVIKPDYCAASVTDYCNCRGCASEASLSEARQERDRQYEFNIGQIATQASLEQEISEVRQGKAMADEALRLCVHRADMAEEQLSKANERCHRIACGHCSCMVWGDDGGTPSCRICNIAASISNTSENVHTVDLGARFMADMEAELRAAEQQVTQQAAAISTLSDLLRKTSEYHRDTCSNQLSSIYPCDCGKQQSDAALAALEQQLSEATRESFEWSSAAQDLARQVTQQAAAISQRDELIRTLWSLGTFTQSVGNALSEDGRLKTALAKL